MEYSIVCIKNTILFSFSFDKEIVMVDLSFKLNNVCMK